MLIKDGYFTEIFETLRKELNAFDFRKTASKELLNQISIIEEYKETAEDSYLHVSRRSS
jgi:exopolyphosphatase/pppGpp-phosphohydrolase